MISQINIITSYKIYWKYKKLLKNRVILIKFFINKNQVIEKNKKINIINKQRHNFLNNQRKVFNEILTNIV